MRKAYKETEIKLQIPDMSQAVGKVLALGGRQTMERHLEDNLLFDRESDSLAQQRKLLRLRIIAEAEPPHAEKLAILTFKGSPEISDGVKKRDEIECEVSGASNLIEILSHLELHPTFRYQKYRTIFTIKDVDLEICLDETPVGCFYELEGEILRIHQFATKLGYNRDDYITQSYATLYYRWCQKTGSKEPHMLFK